MRTTAVVCCLSHVATSADIVQLIGSTFCVLFYAHDNCCLLLQQVQIYMASILMSCPIPRSSALETLMRLQTLLRLYDLVEKLPKSRKRKSRIRKKELPYHKRRRRVNWHEWVRELGPEDFYVHHRMRRGTFEKLLRILGDSLHTEASKVRYGSGPVTPRMQLTMCLKFLGGDSNHDIKKHMGGVCM